MSVRYQYSFIAIAACMLLAACGGGGGSEGSPGTSRSVTFEASLGAFEVMPASFYADALFNTANYDELSASNDINGTWLLAGYYTASVETPLGNGSVNVVEEAQAIRHTVELRYNPLSNQLTWNAEPCVGEAQTVNDFMTFTIVIGSNQLRFDYLSNTRYSVDIGAAPGGTGLNVTFSDQQLRMIKLSDGYISDIDTVNGPTLGMVNVEFEPEISAAVTTAPDLYATCFFQRTNHQRSFTDGVFRFEHRFNTVESHAKSPDDEHMVEVRLWEDPALVIVYPNNFNPVEIDAFYTDVDNINPGPIANLTAEWRADLDRGLLLRNGEERLEGDLDSGGPQLPNVTEITRITFAIDLDM